MDYTIDSYFAHNNSNESIMFLYDDRRILLKLYVFFKFMFVVTYTITLTKCDRPVFFIIMIVVMITSTLNSLRYEYAHFRRYGTMFSSLADYEQWKKELYPKSRILFSIIEFILKIFFMVKIFPPQCYFDNLCEIGESIYKIHTIIIFMIYIITVVFFICLFSSVNGHSNSYYQNHLRSQTISLPAQLLLDNNQNEECCICLDTDNSAAWAILPCGHKFHDSCISTWLLTHQTCPICRLRMIRIS